MTYSGAWPRRISFLCSEVVVLLDIMPNFSGFSVGILLCRWWFVVYPLQGHLNRYTVKKIYSTRQRESNRNVRTSTIMFLTVLILLFLSIDQTIRRSKAVHAPAGKFRKFSRFFIVSAPAIMLVIGGFVYGLPPKYVRRKAIQPETILIPKLLRCLEDETEPTRRIWNKRNHAPVQSGAIAYDVCPDYMVQRMIETICLPRLIMKCTEFKRYIDDIYMEMSKQYDPENKYRLCLWERSEYFITRKWTNL